MQEFFCTNKQRYGPYNHIFATKYLDEEHFQFTYRKRANSKRCYYNLNGKEIDSFSSSSCCHTFYYDRNNRAILDCLKNSNCIYIDGKKIRCFNAKFDKCKLYSCNEHKLFIGLDSNVNHKLSLFGFNRNFSFHKHSLFRICMINIRPTDYHSVIVKNNNYKKRNIK